MSQNCPEKLGTGQIEHTFNTVKKYKRNLSTLLTNYSSIFVKPGPELNAVFTLACLIQKRLLYSRLSPWSEISPVFAKR